MEISAVQSAKLALVSFTGLSKDALHVYGGLAVFLLVVFVFRKPPRSWYPVLAVLLAAVGAELLDMRDDLATYGHWRFKASAHDIGNTVFWPAVLFVLARTTSLFQSSPRGNKEGSSGSPPPRG